MAVSADYAARFWLVIYHRRLGSKQYFRKAQIRDGRTPANRQIDLAGYSLPCYPLTSVAVGLISNRLPDIRKYGPPMIPYQDVYMARKPWKRMTEQFVGHAGWTVFNLGGEDG